MPPASMVFLSLGTCFASGLDFLVQSFDDAHCAKHKLFLDLVSELLPLQLNGSHLRLSECESPPFLWPETTDFDLLAE
jgi:hypothetical protein